MLKLLIKKQLAEVFKGYFYNSKKNAMRSKASIAGMFVLFLVVMVGVLGGIFTTLAISLCGPLVMLEMGWLYFVLMGVLAVMLGAFGSVFNTYSSLYLAKDNGLLLSMPIPVRTIVSARLVNVYLLGAMYSATALLPALVVYWIVAGPSAARLICGVVMIIVVTVFVLLISCLLGWVVAKISLRLKNKSFATVAASLAFLGIYYFFYFKANGFIQDLLLNAQSYGDKIKGAAYGLYLFGRIGEGSWAAASIFLVVTAAVFVAVWTVLTRSFLSIATASGKTVKIRYVEKTAKQRTAFGAFLGKELGRFTSNPNYMLNCGLGILLIPAAGIFMLIMGRDVFEALDGVFAARPGTAAVLFFSMLCLLSSMNDTAAPSVSLEGKSLWIPQSLPVAPKTVLRAKAALQFLLTAIPMLFAGICIAIAVPISPAEKLLLCLSSIVYAAFSALLGTLIGLKMPLLNWTSEIVPIKQGGAIMIALFGGWGISLIPAALYLLIGYKIGAALFLLLLTILLASLTLLLLWRLDTKGADAFSAL